MFSPLEPTTIRPLRRIEFEQLAAAGCFEQEHVELLFGMVIEMPQPTPEHDASVMSVGERLIRGVGDRAAVRIQCGFAASETSLPLPDVLVAPLPTSWTQRPDHALLVVEVARTTLKHDRGAKRTLYASCNVLEYWVVNHPASRVEIYRESANGDWSHCTHHGRGERIHTLAFPDVELAVDDLLPPPIFD